MSIHFGGFFLVIITACTLTCQQYFKVLIFKLDRPRHETTVCCLVRWKTKRKKEDAADKGSTVVYYNLLPSVKINCY